MVETPVVLIIYRRPAHTRQVVAALRAARVREIWVVADGAKPGQEAEVAAARAEIEAIDWGATVHTDYAPANLGCARRVSSGLDRVFAAVESAIVLEDDCVPHPDFFPYAEELLARYRDDERVMAVSGDNFLGGRRRTDASYFFSRNPHCWGWATWRRAWRHFDFAMAQWPAVKQGGWLADIVLLEENVRYWSKIFDATYRGEIDSWAYRWTLACWLQSGLTALPAVNLVANVGFGAGATHTTAEGHAPAAQPLGFPLRHPAFVVRDAKSDLVSDRLHFKSVGRLRPASALAWVRALAERRPPVADLEIE